MPSVAAPAAAGIAPGMLAASTGTSMGATAGAARLGPDVLGGFDDEGGFMVLVILGLLLWCVPHTLKVFAPGLRRAGVARLGEGPWKGLVALVTLLAVVLMVIGYRGADYIPVWTPPPWLWHVNNLLMLLAVFVFIAGSFAGPVRRRLRHPQLTGVKIWTVAHLLVNGHLAAVILFGSLLAWAVVAVIGTNRRDGPRGALPEATTRGLVAHVAVTVVVFLVVGWLHGYFGAWPFPG